MISLEGDSIKFQVESVVYNYKNRNDKQRAYENALAHVKEDLAHEIENENVLRTGAIVMPSLITGEFLPYDSNSLILKNTCKILPFPFIKSIKGCPPKVIANLFRIYLETANVMIFHDGLRPVISCQHTEKRNPYLGKWDELDPVTEQKKILTFELQPVFSDSGKEIMAFIGVCPVCGQMFVTLPKEE